MLKHKTKSQIINRQASYKYELLQEYECGLVLFGWEVKSIKKGAVNLIDSYARFKDGEIWLKQLIINPLACTYQKDNIKLGRDIKLLLHRKEINKIIGTMKQKNLTLIPVKLFTSRNLVKMKLCLGRGKKQHEKRWSIKLKDLQRAQNRQQQE